MRAPSFEAVLVILALLGFVIIDPVGRAQAQQSDATVDVELVLAVDVSQSMDYEEQILQRAGYVDAFRHPDLLYAVSAGLTGRIAVTYIEWAGAYAPRVTVPWRLIEDEASLLGFAKELEDASMLSARGTSIGTMLGHAVRMFDENGFSGLRRVIDVSGDGPNSSGQPVEPARDAVVAQGVTINGLPLLYKEVLQVTPWTIHDLDIYYEDCVIGGPGSFFIAVDDKERFGEAIRRKLILEIAGTPVLAPPEGPIRRVSARIDCMIGEKLRSFYTGP